MNFQSSLANQSSTATSTGAGYILKRSLDMLERSQRNLEGSLVNLERSLAIEHTLSRLVDSQEELRRMVMTLLPVATPTADPPAGNPAPLLKKEQVMRDEEDDISSVSSVSSEEQGDIDDIMDAELFTGYNKTQQNSLSHDGFTAASNDAVTEGFPSGSEMAKKSVKKEGADGSVASSSRAEDGPPKGSERLPGPWDNDLSAIWQCAVCKRRVKGNWYARRQHIQVHEDLRLSCPVAGCPTRMVESNVTEHLAKMHGTNRKSFSSANQEELGGALRKIVHSAAELEGNYFPPSSLVSFAEPMRRVKIKPTCKKCGKGLSPLHQRRDHVGIHINAKFLCPFSECGYSARVMTMFHHLRTVHSTTLHNLTDEERGRYKDARKKFYEKVDAVMGDYFPELQQIREAAKVHQICKKCGKNAMTLRERRDHAGVHIHADFPCPFSECGFSGGVTVMFTHLQGVHKTNLHSLTDEERGRYEDERKKFYEIVDAVMVEFFS
uniref:C2H2-type domain-containing protein n=1 Tax=Steinernema glaseri TaxID=37863 RepID=A0A1I7YBB4_9BILA